MVIYNVFGSGEVNIIVYVYSFVFVRLNLMVVFFYYEVNGFFIEGFIIFLNNDLINVIIWFDLNVLILMGDISIVVMFGDGNIIVILIEFSNISFLNFGLLFIYMYMIFGDFMIIV